MAECWQLCFPGCPQTGKSKYLVGTSFSSQTSLPLSGQRGPRWEPDLLVRTVAVWERDSCTLSASLNPRAAADRKQYLWDMAGRQLLFPWLLNRAG